MNKKRNRDFGENGFEGWGGYMAAKKAKLQDQFNVGATKEGIFKGVAIHVNGYTDPTAEELKRIMMDHGGTYHHYHSTGKTTHIIATNLPDVKIKELKSLHIKVVKPDWITASLKAGILLDYQNFLLYTHQSTSQPCLNFQVTASTSKIDAQPSNSAFDGGVTSLEMSDNHTTKPLASKPARTAVEPNFLSEFYNNSRLHHISTMGAMFKNYINKLRQENKTEFPGRKDLREWMANTSVEAMPHNDDFNFSIEEKNCFSGKIIMHIDMDCFFVSVGLRDRPDLKGVPVAVTHSKGNSGKARQGADIAYERDFYKHKREAKIKNKSEVVIPSRIDDLQENESLSEIASCSYEARRAGVKNGMFMGTAIKLCPDLKTIPYNFEGYKEVAGILYDTVASYTVDIEAVSCDEMFVDCTNLLKETGATPLQFASCLRAQIKERTRCSASTGFGSNRLLARLATKKAKPDGQFYLEDNIAEEHMKSIPVGDLPGVGFSMVHRLKSLGIATCEDLQKLSMEQLRLEGFATKTAQALYNHCRGKDDRPLTFAQQRKSVSAEINYGIRFENNVQAEHFLRTLSAEVHSRLNGDGARSITLKLMVRAKDAPTEAAKYMGHGVCDNVTRSTSLARAVRTVDAISREVLNLYKSVSCKPSDLRGIGIQMSRLEKGSSSEVGALDGFLVKEKDRQTTVTPTVTLPVTPKKTGSRIASDKPKTPVKSPVLGKSKSPAKSPLLGKSNFPAAKRKNNNLPISDNKTIKDFMKPRKYSPQKMKFHLDPDVLAELPEDIRHEILEEYSKSATETINKPQPRVEARNSTSTEPQSLFNVSFSQVDQEFLRELPLDLRMEIETGLESRRRQKQINQPGRPITVQVPEKPARETRDAIKVSEVGEKDLLRESLRDVINLKALLRSWIASTDIPQSCDVQMLSASLQEMIAAREIDYLPCIMRAIRRNIQKRQNPDWLEAYAQIAANVQTTMLAFYQARLNL